MVRGGRERQLAAIFKHSAERGFVNRILIFNKKDDEYLPEYGISEEDVYRLRGKGTWSRLMQIRKIIRDFKPDIVYAWGGFEANFLLLLAPFTKTKIINGSIRHGIVVSNKKHLTRKIGLHLSRHVIANSKAGLKANKLNRGHVLYNGIEEKFSQKLTEEEKQKLIHSVFENYKGEPIIIAVANLVPYKDYSTVFRALKNVKDKGILFRYMAIGEGQMRKQLEVEISQLGLEKEVKLVGRTDRVQEYLHAADLFVHSSRGEGCSNAILEAMAAGLPVFASSTGGTPEITGSGNGSLFEYKNEEQLTSALLEHLQHPELLISKGRRSGEMIQEHFTVEKMIDNYIAIMNKIAG
jgi:glycosyltransferase involved in cell wall biosynthesis